jgi:hypothetical protein
MPHRQNGGLRAILELQHQLVRVSVHVTIKFGLLRKKKSNLVSLNKALLSHQYILANFNLCNGY